MGVWSPWERDKVRQDLLGFISLGPTAEGRGLLHVPHHHVSPGLGGSARPCTAQNPLGCGGEALALERQSSCSAPAAIAVETPAKTDISRHHLKSFATKRGVFQV